MVDKKISEDKIKEIIIKNNEAINISGSSIISVKQEMEKIKEDLVEIDRKISLLL